MSVRKVTAEELLGGKALVTAANPGLTRGFERLRKARAHAAVSDLSKEEQLQR